MVLHGSMVVVIVVGVVAVEVSPATVVNVVVVFVLVMVVVVAGQSPRRSSIAPCEVRPPKMHLFCARDQPHSLSHVMAHLIVLHKSSVVVIVVATFVTGAVATVGCAVVALVVAVTLHS